MNTPIATNHLEITAKIATDAWKQQTKRLTDTFNSLSDQELSADAAPGRNSGIYLLGHLTAVSDRLIETMGWGQRFYPELDEPFLFKPDKSGLEHPDLATLRSCWHNVNQAIEMHLENMQPEDWFARHNSVSDEDFVKEPHRNRLNLLLSRTIHARNHMGQIAFLKSKAE